MSRLQLTCQLFARNLWETESSGIHDARSKWRMESLFLEIFCPETVDKAEQEMQWLHCPLS